LSGLLLQQVSERQDMPAFKFTDDTLGYRRFAESDLAGNADYVHAVLLP
jgi:hypothetical protein